MVLAPGRGSTITCWPRPGVSASAITRTIASIAPPGANGTTMRTGLAGHVASARATKGAARPTARMVRLVTIASDLRRPVVVDAESGTPVGRGLGFGRFKGNAGAIGDPGDGVEARDHGSRVDHCLAPEARLDGSARLGSFGEGAGDRRIDEGQQFLFMADTAAAVAVDDAVEAVVRSTVIAAPPEQVQVAGGSINTLVLDGDAGGHHLDLGMADGAIFAAEVAHGVLVQVHRLEHFPELHHCLRHQAERPLDVAATAAGDGVERWIVVGDVRRREHWHPTKAGLGADRPPPARLARTGRR